MPRLEHGLEPVARFIGMHRSRYRPSTHRRDETCWRIHSNLSPHLRTQEAPTISAKSPHSETPASPELAVSRNFQNRTVQMRWVLGERQSAETAAWAASTISPRPQKRSPIP